MRHLTALVGQASARQLPPMWGRLATCAAVDYRRRSVTSVAVGRLTIGRSLPSCPTRKAVDGTGVLGRGWHSYSGTSLAKVLGAGKA